MNGRLAVVAYGPPARDTCTDRFPRLAQPWESGCARTCSHSNPTSGRVPGMAPAGGASASILERMTRLDEEAMAHVPGVGGAPEGKLLALPAGSGAVLGGVR